MDLVKTKSEWNAKISIAGDKTNAGGGGVMVIIDNNFEHKIHNVIKDINGRYVIIDIELPGIARLLLLNCTHQIEMIQRRPGIQKLNNSLLLNNEFTSEMRKEIKLIIATYACTPAYHPDFIQTQNYKQIELMIDRLHYCGRYFLHS